MTIKLEITEQLYMQLLATRHRVQGSIGLTADNLTADFRAYRTPPSGANYSRSLRLPHGRATVSRKRVSLTLRINRMTTMDDAPDILEREANEAADFVFLNC